MTTATAPLRGRERLLVWGWSAALTALVLGPLVRPGYVLRADMVFTPRQPFVPDTVGLGTAVPRAVPVDAVVTALTMVVDGAVVQRAALAAALLLAGVGAARLVPGGAPAALLAATFAIWNPYVAERLAIGHWSLLLGYAALPWLLAAVLDLRGGTPAAGWRLVGWLGVAAITPGGGLLSLLTVTPLLLWPGGALRPARRAQVLVAWVVLNAPWWVAGALHPARGRAEAGDVALFAAAADTPLGVLGSVLTLGGIWDSGSVPASRASVVSALWGLGLLALLIVGFRVLLRVWGRQAWGVAVAGLVGVVLSLAGALAPAALAWVVGTVPGGGLLRDGQRLAAPFVVLVAVSAAAGAVHLLGRLAAAPARSVLTVGLMLLPIAVLPDLAWGVGGRLQPVRYPEDWAQVRATLVAHPGGGDVVALPFQPFRQPRWNASRTVLDPTPRYLNRTVVVSDTLPVRVGDEVVAVGGADRRAAAVERALAAGHPLGDTLPALGIGWVVVDLQTPGEINPAWLGGAVRVAGGDTLELWRLARRDVQGLPWPSSWPLVALAYAGAATVWLAGLVLACRSARASCYPGQAAPGRSTRRSGP
jgi:hypothetical protein